jgi:hypothetical protein
MRQGGKTASIRIPALVLLETLEREITRGAATKSAERERCSLQSFDADCTGLHRFRLGEKSDSQCL